MARRSQRTRQKADAPGGKAGHISATRGDERSPNEHFVVFQIADGSFGFRLDDVDEIVRLPGLAHMPLGPKSLLGLANLRGVVLPVVSLRRLLGLPDIPSDDAIRVIVVDRGALVGFVVDRIDNLLALPADRIEKDDAGAGTVDPDFLDGVVKGAEGEGTIKILNSPQLLRAEFAQLGVAGSRAATRVSISAALSEPVAAESRQQVSLLTFDLGQQEYALPLDSVREIIPLPDQVSSVPRAETAVVGVVTLRDRLLPLVSLRELLGLPRDLEHDESRKVIVLSLGGGFAGLVVDRTREILRIDSGLIDPAPPLLTRGGGDAEIVSICRLDHGRRLVAVLSPDRLFRSDLVRRLLAEHGNEGASSGSQTEGHAMADDQFIIFRLGDQEYGLPIGAVDEIVRPPDQITHLPKAPAFIDGVINLRGNVVPIVDLRRRFELPAREPVSTRRILVVAVGGGKTGFMVDGVSEVMNVPTEAIRLSPDLSPEQMRLIGRVANLATQNRMILLVDPAQLLDQVEADVLAKFDRSDLDQASKAS